MKNKKYYPWLVVGLLWGVALLNYMDRQMLSTMRPAMMIDFEELNSAANFGRLMAVFLWIYGLTSPFAGMIADRMSRKKLIVLSLVVWSFVTYCIGHTTEYSQIYWLRALMGLSEALYIPAALALIAEYHQDKTRSLAIGIHMTGLYAGQAVGGFGATVAAAFSWQETFHWFGIIGVIYGVVLMLFLHDKEEKKIINKVTVKEKKRKEPFWKGFVLLAGNISFWVILFNFMAPSLPGWATKNWLPTLFSESLHIPMSQAGPLATITIAISSFIGVIFGGILSDKWVQKNIKGRVYIAAMGLGLTIPTLILIGLGNSFVVLICAAVCFGIGYGMFDANNMSILCQFISNKYRATAYGLMNMVGVFSGAAITSWLGKANDSGSLGKDFALLAVIVFISLTMMLYFLRPKVVDMKDE